MSEHIMSSKFYYGIWIALLGPDGRHGCGFLHGSGPLNTIVALASPPSKLCSSYCSSCT